MPDFTHCKRLLGNAYAGANGKKIGIEYNGEQYMLKFPPSGQTKRTELSYTNSCLSEHIAPIYDCGSCLLPQADETVMHNVLSSENELLARVYTFPTSAIKHNGSKINYYNFLNAAENKDCNAAVLRMIPQIDMDAIDAFIDDVPFLTELQRSFYRTYLYERYDRILIPVYDELMGQQPGLIQM
ncbi:MAG: hypothetical protein IJD63_00230 [Oscillospiraceae bacterium]|nr:hypothetical protein [Oscillospiraceae bacterium]